MQKLFIKLMFFFKERYISSLVNYNIIVNPKYITEETKNTLSEEFKNLLEMHTILFNENVLTLNKNKIEWEDKVGTKLLSTGSRNEVNKIKKSLKKIEGETALYMVSFDKELKIQEAKTEIKKLGFNPASFIETIIFIQQYKDKLKRLPIITIDGFFDCDKKINILENDTYSICYSGYEYESNKFGFERIGELESSEFYLGAIFSKNTLFLVKEI